MSPLSTQGLFPARKAAPREPLVSYVFLPSYIVIVLGEYNNKFDLARLKWPFIFIVVCYVQVQAGGSRSVQELCSRSTDFSQPFKEQSNSTRCVFLTSRQDFTMTSLCLSAFTPGLTFSIVYRAEQDTFNNSEILLFASKYTAFTKNLYMKYL